MHEVKEEDLYISPCWVLGVFSFMGFLLICFILLVTYLLTEDASGDL